MGWSIPMHYNYEVKKKKWVRHENALEIVRTSRNKQKLPNLPNGHEIEQPELVNQWRRVSVDAECRMQGSTDKRSKTINK